MAYTQTHVSFRAMKLSAMVLVALASCAIASAPPAQTKADASTLTPEAKANALKMIEDRRHQALDAINSVHGSKAGEAWGFSAGSGFGNMVPAEFGGTLIGLGADVSLLCGWFWNCKSSYNDAVDFNKTMSQLMSEFKVAIECAAVQEAILLLPKLLLKRLQAQGANFGAEALEGEVERVVRVQIQEVPEVIWIEANNAGRRVGGRAAAGVAANEALEAERVAGRLAAREAEQEAAQVIARGGAVHGVEAVTGWIPIIGSIIGGISGLALMRWSTGQVNDEFRDDYAKAVNALHDELRDWTTKLPTTQ